MSLIKVHFFSKALNRMTAVNVILPMPRKTSAEIDSLPVLYLLHGMGDDHTMWLRRTNIETWAIEKGIAVIMPNGDMSCYENMVSGGRYADYLLEELPKRMQAMFPITGDRALTFIAGCSMGGCGAIKLALAAPEKYCVCGCFSAGILEYRPEHPVNREMLARAYGEDIESADERILRSLHETAQSGPDLQILHYWGDRDILKEEALKMRDRIDGLRSEHIRYMGIELPGTHDWNLWNECIRDMMDRLPVEAPKGRLF